MVVTGPGQRERWRGLGRNRGVAHRVPQGFHELRHRGVGDVEPDVAERIQDFYESFAIPADSFAWAVAFAISQPEDVNVNEIPFRPTRREL